MSSTEEQPTDADEQIYIPACILLTQGPRKIPLATRERPDEVYGFALRVGRTGTCANDLPLYD